jgi:hypothetical protein
MPSKHVSPARLTVNDYCRAFRQIDDCIGEHHWRMLRTHYRSPGKVTTARRLAHALGYKWRPTNIHYGGLAHMLADALRVSRESLPFRCWLMLICKVEEGNRVDRHIRLIMRPQVVQALEKLKWV